MVASGCTQAAVKGYAMSESESGAHVEVVEGAGGLVLAMVSNELCVAVVQPTRHGPESWCLPKGHLIGDEPPLQAALREVREETGLICEAADGLGFLEYTVMRHGAQRAKRTQFWLMIPIAGEIDRLSETDRAEIVRARWHPVSDAEGALTHPAEREFLSSSLIRLRESPA